MPRIKTPSAPASAKPPVLLSSAANELTFVAGAAAPNAVINPDQQFADDFLFFRWVRHREPHAVTVANPHMLVGF